MKRVLVASVLGGLLLLGTPTLARLNTPPSLPT